MPPLHLGDPIVVRFGKAELSDASSGNDVSERKEENDEEIGLSIADEIPCPSLEFRLVNRLHDTPSGEIGE